MILPRDESYPGILWEDYLLSFYVDFFKHCLLFLNFSSIIFLLLNLFILTIIQSRCEVCQLWSASNSAGFQSAEFDSVFRSDALPVKQIGIDNRDNRHHCKQHQENRKTPPDKADHDE